MNKLLLLVLSIISPIMLSQVGIGTVTPSDKAMLEISSTSDNGATYQGFLPPRVPSNVQRDLINPSTTDIGMTVFVMSSQCLQIWNGTTWESIHCSPMGGTNTTIKFDNLSQTVIESVGGISFDFVITNPSVTVPTIITIAASSYDEIDEVAQQTIVIPANSTNYTSSSIFNITDDDDIETTDDLVFSITSISGGLGTPAIGTNNIHIVSILDNDGTFTSIGQDFDAITTWTYSSNVAFFDNGSDGFFGIDNGTTLSHITNLNNNFIGTSDLHDEGDNGTPNFATLSFATVNIIGGQDLHLTFAYDAFELDNGNDVYYTVNIDGVDQPEIFLIEGTSNLTVNGTVTVPIPNGSTTASLKVRFKQNGPDQLGFDNFSIN